MGYKNNYICLWYRLYKCVYIYIYIYIYIYNFVVFKYIQRNLYGNLICKYNSGNSCWVSLLSIIHFKSKIHFLHNKMMMITLSLS